ncbi:MAG: hypothetical protein EPO55_11390 [Reyranella sp.]|uniref:YbaY family lipoprotein n=1 Tax=Reyranella sp. TaxID=1929291 RepID=UPI001209351B|nr:YbaY family lipoprotein [Reyranella sp.]TAJ39773.1 MAG: hypothetical protein EPO55_11390 [Reyranella sp.]
MPRPFSLMLLLAAVAAPAFGQDVGGLSSTALSRCAGRVGLDMRQSDAAFGVIALDGMPWVTIERTEESVGTQPISTTVTGTGEYRRRNGTSVPFRFTCVLDAEGQALMFHPTALMRRLGDVLPPSIVVNGMATYAGKTALPHGVELRVQLLDVARSPTGDGTPEVLAEQVVRSGWQVPIPFALRLPKETSFEGRRLAITARLVLAHQALFELREPLPVVGTDFLKPIELVLERAGAPKQ